jgi:hypothetical protein
MPTATRALLADGRVVSVRQLGPVDAEAALRLHTGLPEHDQYTRFFTLHPAGLDRLVGRIVTGSDGHDYALGAFLGDELVGMASFSVLADPHRAEVALVVDHRQQAHGLDQLAAVGLGVSTMVSTGDKYTSPATTCCFGGSATTPPTWPCCTCRRSPRPT